eukprot:scaffold11071_cov73-Cylindrotheca_fusiformis.AAC.1
MSRLSDYIVQGPVRRQHCIGREHRARAITSDSFHTSAIFDSEIGGCWLHWTSHPDDAKGIVFPFRC